MGQQSDDKFENNDLPIILLALKQARDDARDHRVESEITVKISRDGGVLGIFRESKKQYK